MSWGNACSLLIAAVIFASWYLWSHREIKEEVMPQGVQIVKYTELGVPPSISRQTTQTTQVSAVAAAAAPSIGIPEPVPDEQARQSTIATQSEMADALAPITASELAGGADSIVVDISDATSPEPGQFVAFDELPVLLSHEAPVYPELAKEYHPYTAYHIFETLQILLFTGLGFFLLLKKLVPDPTISLDMDWFYRKGWRVFLWFARKPVQFVDTCIGELYRVAGLVRPSSGRHRGRPFVSTGRTTASGTRAGCAGRSSRSDADSRGSPWSRCSTGRSCSRCPGPRRWTCGSPSPP